MSDRESGPSWRLKFDRAGEYLAELTEAFKGLLEDPAYRVGAEFDAQTGIQQITFGDRGPAPVGWSLIVGDMVQNLRASLDHMVWHLTPEIERRSHPRRPEFPICENATDFKDRGIGAIRTLGEEIGAAIEGLQPYRTHESSPTDSPLWWLSELSNIDKHRRIHMIRSLVELYGLKLSQAGQPDIYIGEVIPPSEAIARAHHAIEFPVPEGTQPEKQVYVNLHATLKVLFDDAGAVTGRRAISTLGLIRDAVDAALRTLETFA